MSYHCQDKKMERAKELLSGMTPQQLEYLIKKWETALGVGSTPGGIVEQVLTDTVSTSSLSKNEEDCKHEL